MPPELLDLTWPFEQGLDCGIALAAAAGVPHAVSGPHDVSYRRTDQVAFADTVRDRESTGGLDGSRSAGYSDMEDLRDRIERTGLEVVVSGLTLPALGDWLESPGPSLLLLGTGRARRFLAVLGRSRRRIEVLTPQLRRRKVSRPTIRATLLASLADDAVTDAKSVLEAAGLDRRAVQRAEQAILEDRFASRIVGRLLLVRPAPGAGFGRQLAYAGALRMLVLFGVGVFSWTCLFTISWWLIGRAVLDGRFEAGWLAGWALLLLTLVPLRVAWTWAEGKLAVMAGGLLRRRILAGALALDSDDAALHGTGHAIGRALEIDSLESVATIGGLHGPLALVEFFFAMLVLAAGAAPVLETGALCLWLGLAGLWTVRYATRRLRWTDARLRLTNDLTERMAGHRTRLIQEAPDRRNDEEDADLADYHRVSHATDRRALAILAMMTRGWPILGLLALLPAVLAGALPAGIAVSLGGVLLAQSAFQRAGIAIVNLVDAGIAWRRLRPLFDAGARPVLRGVPVATGQTGGPVLLEARSIAYRYPARPSAGVRLDELAIGHGERLLLEGPSGAGKSTLLALLAGLRNPDDGILLVDGLDRHALGHEGWRRRVALVPQFHENFVFNSTLAFNLLVGDWPPTGARMRTAESLCRELGLGPLLDRMPLGLYQIVGETGWQLSQGERHRVFVARALLQHPDLLLLDESFASLDPDTLDTAWNAVDRHATGLVIASHARF